MKSSIIRYEWRSVVVTLPKWLENLEKSLVDTEFTSDEEMMALAIELSAKNTEEGTGGPFGCAIFERNVENGVCKLFSVGVNRVVNLNNSTLHGEMVAIQFAQKKLQSYSLKQSDGKYRYIMCTSCEPCAMCLGGIFWAGLTELITAATKNDAEAIGFDEGPVFAESYAHLEKTGVVVKKDVLQKEGAEVLKRYGMTGVIYTPE